MSEAARPMVRWRDDGVRVVRAGTLGDAKRGPGGSGRATVFDFTGSGGETTWIGSVTLAPGVATGAHHHGRHEVAIFVVRSDNESIAVDLEVNPADQPEAVY